MDLLYIIFLAIAISLDGFFAGMTYGIRKVKVPFIPMLIISTVSACMIAISMALGSTVLEWISPGLASFVGAAILIVIGILVIRETYKTLAVKMVEQDVNDGYSIIYAEEEAVQCREPRRLAEWKLKPFGIVIQIIKEPMRADFDLSGSISNYEALFLGLALSMDAFGAGFGAALTGASPVLIPISVGVMQLVCVTTGNFIGGRFNNLLNQQTAYLPGLILICLGVLKLI